ncbi:MAG: hypothetical protein AD742_16305 [Methylibium sp. NZG]|nr:MAG: hypothetical protein AD742_16305 [Methylibium sp. NZG]
MITTPPNAASWSRNRPPPTSTQSAQDEQNAADRSEPSTQIARDSDDYLGETAGDVGRQTRAGEHELFVSCNPAPAMQQQFEHLRPEFIAVHDIGTTSSRKLLTSIASASGRAVHKLVIRRQGYGTALATIHFVELPSAGGAKLRMYSTDCETETSWRQSLAHMLLAFSRLGVIMVGDRNAPEIATVLGRLRDSMARGPWLNEQLLLLPLGSASNLVNHGMELARGSNVNVRTTPQVTRATDAWGFISGTWNRLTERKPAASGNVAALAQMVATPASRGAAPPTPAPVATDATAAVTSMPAATTRPAGATGMVEQADAMPVAVAALPVAVASGAAFAETEPSELAASAPPVPARPAATVASAVVSQPATADNLRRYVRQISELTGVVGCAVFDAVNGSRVAYAGTGPSAVDLAAQGAELMSAILKASANLELGRTFPEAAITLESHHLLLRAVPRHPGLALHTVLDRGKANLTLVRLQVMRMDTLFDDGA